MNRNKNKFSLQQGFGILEIVVTLLIIGVTLLLFQLASNSIVLNKYNRYKEVALRVAEDKIQELRTTAYASLPSTGTFSDSQISSLPNGAGNLTMTQIDTGLTEATVTVSWRNPTGDGTQEVTLSTYLWQYGLGK